MMLNLKNKRALVCGSTKGIGKATAIALAQEGVHITLIARNENKLKQVLKELPNGSQQHDFIVVDFQNPKELYQRITAYLNQNDPFHILVNNTGGPKGGLVFDADIAEFEAAFSQHLKCNHILAQALVPGMKQLGIGRIVNIISTSVKQPIDGLGVSNTTRGAVASWSKTLANELGQFNITVNNVLPGATSTERLTEIINSQAVKKGVSTEELSSTMKQNIPMRRFANPDEVAKAIVFLASSAASYINGINLPVDGGSTKSL